VEAFLNTSIKEVIGQFPELEAILSKHGIGCGPCNVGICLLKDIVDIHQLPEADKKDLMDSIAESISASKGH
jgi:hypothetical protein